MCSCCKQSHTCTCVLNCCLNYDLVTHFVRVMSEVPTKRSIGLKCKRFDSHLPECNCAAVVIHKCPHDDIKLFVDEFLDRDLVLVGSVVVASN